MDSNCFEAKDQLNQKESNMLSSCIAQYITRTNVLVFPLTHLMKGGLNVASLYCMS